MGDAIITFVAVLVGAAASLAGSVVVNRTERRTAIRQQIYMIAADLVPKMDEVVRLRDPSTTLGSSSTRCNGWGLSPARTSASSPSRSGSSG